MADGIDRCGDFFPPLFRQLARRRRRNRSGAEVFRQLADHYDARLKRRRIFLAAITWPMIQLAAAVVVVGFVIWIMGVIGDGKIDILGFGLIGTWAWPSTWRLSRCVGIVVDAGDSRPQRGLMWTRPIQRGSLLRCPCSARARDAGPGPTGLGRCT